MQTRRYRTNLHCGSCVSAVKPLLDRAPGVESWDVDTDSPDKVLTVRSDTLPPEAVRDLVGRAGFEILGELSDSPSANGKTETTPHETTGHRLATYYPLALVLLYLLAGTGFLQWRAGSFHAMQAMSDFMGLFFVAFAFFKLLDVSGFASAFAGYDVLAHRWPAYGYVYPFIELALGAGYLAGWRPLAVNIATLVVTLLGSIGVLQALLNRRAIRCACLGTVFNLPMTTVSLAEDLGMAIMAAIMIAMG